MRVDTDNLGERIAEHVAHIDAAMYLLVTDLREFDKAGGWYHQGFQTCAHWLSWRVGWTLGTAREHVRVANKLAELPQIDQALRKGEMSYCKVRAMTRVATPANESTLLGEAEHTTGQQLEVICRKYAMVQRHGTESNEKDDSERRHVKRRDQPDGMVQIVATLHPEEAATVWAALERIVKEGYRERADVPAGTPMSDVLGQSASGAQETDTTTNDRHDHVPAGTLGHDDRAGTRVSDVLARSAPGGTEPDKIDAENDHHDVPAGTAVHLNVPAETLPSDPKSRVVSRVGVQYESVQKQRFSRADALVVMADDIIRGSRPNRSPIELVVTVAAADLRARPSSTASATSADDVVATTTIASDLNIDIDADSIAAACYADGTAVSLAVARRLACDAGLVGIVEDGEGAVLSVGRKTRTIPGAMKRALLRRDRGCTFPGCTNRLFVEGHHLKHWADGGETKLGNLASVCGYHHRFVHEYGYAVELVGTAVRFLDPDGNVVRAAPEPAQPERRGWETIRARNAELAIDANTPACGWDGHRIDLVACIDDLVRADDRGVRCTSDGT